MIIVDKALERRHQEGNLIRVAMVGAGFMGCGIGLQVATAAPGMNSWQSLIATSKERTEPTWKPALRKCGKCGRSRIRKRHNLWGVCHYGGCCAAVPS